MVPFIFLASSIFFPFNENWNHIIDNVLYDYFFNSIILSLGVGFFTFLIGTSTAWLTSIYEFPFRRIISWLLLMPLAMPAYIIAITYVGIIDSFNFLPDIRNLFGAIIMISLVLYPYVYILARGAFLEQSKELHENSQILGATHFEIFIKVSIPMARPAIILGVTLSAMEALADYGTVEFLGVPTFTTGIFRTWFGMNDTVTATQMATLLLSIVFIFVFIEQQSRKKIRYSENIKTQSKLNYRITSKKNNAVIISICLLPLVFGFVIPFIQLIYWSLFVSSESWDYAFLNVIKDTLLLSFFAAFIITLISIMITYVKRLRSKSFTNKLMNIITLGYAIPGPVVAIAVLIPFATFDNFLNQVLISNFDISVGLIFSGSLFILIFAYCIRFLTVSSRTIKNGLESISLATDDAAKSMGASTKTLLTKIHFPMLKTYVLTSFLIVFIDVMKELPLTSILRPFNFNTLSVKAFELASDEKIADASNAAIMIVVAGIIPVIFITKNILGKRNKV
jgi:iron(III) transport system permease protein